MTTPEELPTTTSAGEDIKRMSPAIPMLVTALGIAAGAAGFAVLRRMLPKRESDEG